MKRRRHDGSGPERRALVKNKQSIEAEEHLLEVLQRARRDGPESEAAEIVQAAEVYAVRFGVSLATAIAAVQRGEQ
jgi:hypothetical protein